MSRAVSIPSVVNMTRLRRTRLALLSLIAALVALVAVTVPVGAAPVGKPLVAPKGATVSEAAGRAVVKLALKAKAKKTLRIPFKTVAGTARAGSDFKAAKGKVVIKKGAKSGKVTIVLVNDRVAEPVERFTVRFAGGSAYRLKTTSATVTIKDDDGAAGGGGADAALAKVHQWSGDITVHVTQHQVMNPTIVDEDWTFVAHLVLAPQPYTNVWLPLPASSWTLQGTHTSSDPTSQCAAHPDHRDFDTSGSFMADPQSGYPQTGKAQWLLKTQVGTTPSVMEAGPISAADVYHSWAYYSGSCHESVSDSSTSVGFQTHWRTSDPVGHPGTFPFTLKYGASGTSLTVDFTDDYSQQAGWTTHSRVTGTLHGS